MSDPVRPAQPAPVRPSGRPETRPLVLTSDENLLDDLQRLAAAADLPLTITGDIPEARRSWRTAPVILIGHDHTEALATTSPPHRNNVLIVAPGPGPGTRGPAARAPDPRESDPHALGPRASDVYRDAVAIGAQDVVFLPEAEAWLVEWLAEAMAPAASAITVCVAGGRGGAGATVTAVALAVTAARAGEPVLLIDADPLGGGIDLALGLENAEGARWPAFTDRRGRLSAGALRGALPTVDTLAVLSRSRDDPAPIPAPAMRAVLDAARRGAALVVIDLPRHPDEAATEALAAADVALLIAPGDVRGVAASSAVAADLSRHASDLRVAARTGRGRLPPETVAASLGLPLAGRVPDEPALPAALDSGVPPALSGRGPVARFCRTFLSALHPPGRTAA